MKNRKPEKLKLHLETLRSLDGSPLQRAQGGGPGGSGHVCSALDPCQSISNCFDCITVFGPDCF